MGGFTMMELGVDGEAVMVPINGDGISLEMLLLLLLLLFVV